VNITWQWLLKEASADWREREKKEAQAGTGEGKDDEPVGDVADGA
jgi:hypothetical protein